MKLLSLSRKKQLLHERLLQQNLELREARQKSLSDTVARRRLVEDQDTILELTGKIQELQNEINCMNDSKDFQDAESIRSGNSHVASRPVSFTPHPIPEGMLGRSFGVPSCRGGPPSFWNTHGISGNVFASPDASSSAPYPQELNPWGTTIEEPLHMSTAEKSERNQFLQRTERPVVDTSVIQARSSDDSKDPNVEKEHERTRRLVTETNTENVPDSFQTRSVHEGETFSVGDKNTS